MPDDQFEDCQRGINSKPVLDSAETGIVFGTFIPSQACVATSGFYKVDAATGKELWNFQLTGFVWTSAAMAMKDTVVYAVAEDAFGSGDGRMYAFDFATEEELWYAAVLGSEVFFPAFLDTPIVGEDGSAYLASENTAVYVINKDGQRIFNYTTGSAGSTTGTPLLAVPHHVLFQRRAELLRVQLVGVGRVHGKPAGDRARARLRFVALIICS